MDQVNIVKQCPGGFCLSNKPSVPGRKDRKKNVRCLFCVGTAGNGGVVAVYILMLPMFFGGRFNESG